MKKIFISYRRADAEYAAGALGRDLRRHFGEEQVFRDKENIGAGVSWKQQVLQEIDRDSALLVLIAKDWANARDSHGQRRLENPEDPLRMEIRDGIRDGATVIPILLENAEMPAEGDLPADMKPLADLNARRLRDGDWPYDLGRICDVLEKAGFKPTLRSSPAPGAEHAMPGGKARGVSVKMIVSYVVGVLSLSGFSDMRDGGTQWGLALLGTVALVLAVLAFRDFRRGKAGNRWGTIGAIALGALVTVGHVGGAIHAPGEDPPVAEGGGENSSPQMPGAPASSPAGGNVVLPAKLAAAPPPPVAAVKVAEPEEAAPSAESPGAGDGVISIDGVWEDGTSQYVFKQDGHHVSMDWTPEQGVLMSGDGTLSGRQVKMTLEVSGHSVGKIRLTVSPDGRALRGNMTVGGGEKVPIVLTR